MNEDSVKRSYQNRLARWSGVAAVLTFFLVVLGGIVRVSDSGLGCGPAGSGSHGWPFCDGRILPLLDTGTIIEYSHRTLAGMVAVVAVLLLFYIWKRLRDSRTTLILASIAVGSILIQAVLGGLTVEENLNEALVAAHLGLAMLLLAVFLALRRATSAGPSGHTRSSMLFKSLTALMVATVLGTIVAGGYIAGTEGHGRESHVRGTGAHMACGKEFPACQGKFLPFGASRPIDIHLTHRAFMYAASALILVLFLIVASVTRYRRLLPITSIGVGILFLQVLLGALNVWVGEKGWLVIAHLSVGTVLWIWSIQFTFNLLPAPRLAHAKYPTGGRAQAEPV